MPYRQNAFAPNCVYHIYNRGINRMTIFACPDNYVYLLGKVKSLSAELAVRVLAYCLMPNHYHFVLRQDGETPLSVFMQRLFITYTQAFNKQQGRRGPLFEERFRHILVDRDEYLLHVCRYVHLNPVVAGLAHRPEQWPYSNYLEWIEARAGMIVVRDFIRQFFPSADAYRAFVQGRLAPDLARSLKSCLLDDDLPERFRPFGKVKRQPNVAHQ